MLIFWGYFAIKLEVLNRLSHVFNTFYRIIGSPPEHDWPEYCSLPWGQFMGYIHVPLKRLIPELCDEGEDLLKV